MDGVGRLISPARASTGRFPAPVMITIELTVHPGGSHDAMEPDPYPLDAGGCTRSDRAGTDVTAYPRAVPEPRPASFQRPLK
jgi:hypothetical protein